MVFSCIHTLIHSTCQASGYDDMNAMTVSAALNCNTSSNHLQQANIASANDNRCGIWLALCIEWAPRGAQFLGIVAAARSQSFFGSFVCLLHLINIDGDLDERVRALELCESRGDRPGLSVPNSPWTNGKAFRAQELCESRGDRPGLSVPNSPWTNGKAFRAQELCESRGDRPGLSVPNSPWTNGKAFRAQELCESRGDRPGLSVPNSPWTNGKAFRAQELCESRGDRPGLSRPLWFSVDVKQHWTDTELWSCVKVEMAVLGSPSLIVLVVSVDVKQPWTNGMPSELRSCVKVEVAVLGSPSLIVLELTVKPSELRSCVKVEVTVPYGLCGRKATLNRHRALGAVWKSRWPSWAPCP